MNAVHGRTVSSLADIASSFYRGGAKSDGNAYPAGMTETSVDTTWRTRLKQTLAEKGLSMRQVSLEAKLGPGAIHSWLSEGKDPSVHNLLAVCGVLGVSLIYMLKGYNLSPEVEEVVGLLEQDQASRDAVLALVRARQR